ncbi:MAG: hypothetical protein KJZ93_15455 [Caldilineaceae bacterium]|nr:hypothetical protein [Caldilineaceae bacterium]
MVRVHFTSTDHINAWRVRDALAAHPLLGGATAHITICAHLHGIVLEGWVIDESTLNLAMRLARRAAGRRAIQMRLCTRQERAQSDARQTPESAPSLPRR